VLARVALLQAHAQCANIAAAAGATPAGGSAPHQRGYGGAAPAAAVGELCAGMVAKAQAPYSGMLRVLWGALLQDHAVLSTQDLVVASHYRSILFGDANPAVADSVTPCYEAAWPAVLAALTARLPPSDQISAARAADLKHQAAAAAAPGAHRDGWSEFVDVVSASDGAAANAGAWEEQAAARAWTVYAFLADYSLVMLSDHAGQTADAFASQQPRECIAAAQRAAAALSALRALLSPALLAAGLVPLETSRSAVQLITAVAYDTLYPMTWSVALGTARSARPSSGGALSARAARTGGGSSGTTAAAVGVVAEAAAGVVCALCQGLPAAVVKGDADLHNSLVEALLELTSIAAPYSLAASPSAAAAHRAAAAVPYLPASSAGQGPALPSAASTQLTRALTAALAAARHLLAQQLAAERAVEPLCKMGVRLLLTAVPGPQLAAAQAFFTEACMPAAVAAGAAGVDRSTAATACSTLIGAARQAMGDAGSSGPQLQAVLAGLLSAAAAATSLQASSTNTTVTNGSCSSSGHVMAECLGVLLTALAPTARPAVQRGALEALRTTLQEAHAEYTHQQKAAASRSPSSSSSGKAVLAERCLGALAPQVAALVHAATHRPAAVLEGERLAAVVEGLKVRFLNVDPATAGSVFLGAWLTLLLPLPTPPLPWTDPSFRRNSPPAPSTPHPYHRSSS